MASPAADIATHVASQLAAATLGTNCFYGPERSPADGCATKAVFFIGGGGPAAEPDNGSSSRIIRATVQALVRGEQDEYANGATWAQSIFDEIEHASVVGYINVRNLRAAPTYIGLDPEKFHLWSWDVEMLYED